MIEQIADAIREPSYSLNVVHTTMEDFQRARVGVPVIVVIGSCGSGKSTFLNRMCGLRMVQSGAPDYSINWVDQRGFTSSPYLVSGVSSTSVTKQVSFINTCFGGDPQKPVILIDTPGHDIPEMEQLDQKDAREELQMMAADFHDKLKAIGRIDCLIVLHNDVYSNRMNAATYAMLQMVHEKFANLCAFNDGDSADEPASGAEAPFGSEKKVRPIWDNVIVAYSKCNRNTDSWKNELSLKYMQMRDEIRSKLGTGTPFGTSVGDSVGDSGLNLGGGDKSGVGSEAILRLKITTVGGLGGDTQEEIDEDLMGIWEMVQTMEPIDTRNLKPFLASFARFEQLIRERNEYEARYHAVRSYPGVLLKFVSLFFGLSLRSKLLPPPLNMFLLDFKGPYDEILATGILCHSIGMQKVVYSCEHLWGILVGVDDQRTIAANDAESKKTN